MDGKTTTPALSFEREFEYHGPGDATRESPDWTGRHGRNRGRLYSRELLSKRF